MLQQGITTCGIETDARAGITDEDSELQQGITACGIETTLLPGLNTSIAVPT